MSVYIIAELRLFAEHVRTIHLGMEVGEILECLELNEEVFNIGSNLKRLIACS